MAFDLASVLANVPEVGTGRDRIEYIRLERIQEDPNNFYKLSGIEELAANIELCGLQQPIRVREIPDSNGNYRIVSGHRRRKAVELLAEENPRKWEEVPCIVEQDDVSPNLQQLRLIYANANTRTMTSAEVSEQAVQVEKLLYQLKEEGYEFPGRMRDHVAQAVNTSKSKLSRLKVIREKLAECWQKAWKENKLGESAAYALARLQTDWQQLIFLNCSNPSMLYESTVQEYAKRLEAINEMACGEKKDMVCGHKIVMMEKSCRDRWQDPCKSRCCWNCPNLRTCKSSCKAAEGKKKDLKAAYKADAEKATQEQELRDKPMTDIVRNVFDRVGQARAAANVTVAELYEAQGKHYNEKTDNEMYLRLESGEAKVGVNTPLPFGYSLYASNVRALIRVADLLNVSIDYLLGREEPVAKMPESGTVAEQIDSVKIWYTANVEPKMGQKVIVVTADGYVDTAKYTGCGIFAGLIDDCDPVSIWTKMPDEEDVSQVTYPLGWRTGNPEAYGTYAAYVRVADVNKLLLKELLWDGEEWFLHGDPIHEDVTVAYWAERPEV